MNWVYLKLGKSFEWFELFKNKDRVSIDFNYFKLGKSFDRLPLTSCTSET